MVCEEGLYKLIEAILNRRPDSAMAAEVGGHDVPTPKDRFALLTLEAAPA